MKSKILAAVFVGVALGCAALPGLASAEATGTVKPVVHVVGVYTGSLSMGGEVDGNGVMDLGYLVPGGEPATRTLSLDVTANANWHLTVTTTQNLTYADTGAAIPPEDFTFTSSGCAGAVYREWDTPFRAAGDSDGVQVTVDVVTDGPQTDRCAVDVLYRLEVPATQDEGYYSAGDHVYTLVVGD